MWFQKFTKIYRCETYGKRDGLGCLYTEFRILSLIFYILSQTLRVAAGPNCQFAGCTQQQSIFGYDFGGRDFARHPSYSARYDMSHLIRWFEPGDYGLARLALEKCVGALFVIAFLNALNQFKPLLGERGLLPVPIFVREVPVKESPSLFFLFSTDKAFTMCSWIGIALSCAVVSGIFEKNGWILLPMWTAIW